MISTKIYEIDGNVVKLKNNIRNELYFLTEYIHLEKPELSDEDQDILIKIISEIVSSFECRGYYKANIVKSNMIGNSKVYSFRQPERISSKNYVKRGICVSALYNPLDMPAFMNFNEIKSAYRTLIDTPAIKTAAGLFGAIFAYLVGGIDALIYTMIVSGIVYAIVGNTPSGAEYPNLAMILLKRLQHFAIPFVILALINTCLYACTLGSFFKLEIVTALRAFFIIIFIVSNTLGAFQRIEENGYKIPIPIVATAKSIEQGVKTGVTTILTDMLNNVKKGKK